MSLSDQVSRTRWFRRGWTARRPQSPDAQPSGQETPPAANVGSPSRAEPIPSPDPVEVALASTPAVAPTPPRPRSGSRRTRPRTPTAPAPASGAQADSPPPPEAPVATGPTRDVRILLVEDVPQVADLVREVLRSQETFKLVAVTTDGRRVEDDVAEHRPDVVIVDALLQGRMKGPIVIERLRRARNPIPCVAVTPAGQPLPADTAGRVDAVLDLPFGTFDLVRAVRGAITAGAARNPTLASRVVAVFSAKGGVGKTTIALNLAVALKGLGLRTALVDGSLQYGDVRRLLRVDDDVPSIIDLPTDSVRSSDLVELMAEGPGGIEVLLAPPRLEQAELITSRDLEKILDMLRRTYHVVVIDTQSSLAESTLALLDAADVVIQVVTPETATLDVTRLAAQAFIGIGYPPAKLQLLLNRADTMGSLSRDQIRAVFGRDPDHTIASDWALVAESNARGTPFLVTGPEATVSADVRAVAGRVAAIVGAPPRDVVARGRRRGRT